MASVWPSTGTRRDVLRQAVGIGIGAAVTTGSGRGAWAGPEATGRWSGVHAWPDVAIHAHLLPTSTPDTARVLSYSDDGVAGLKDRNGGFSKSYVVDIPASGAPATTWVYVANNVTNLFCSGHTFLADGTLLAMGGHVDYNFYGASDINLFAGPPYGWHSVPNALNAGRWYCSVMLLPNGEALVLSGTIAGSADGNPLPQVWRTHEGGGLRDLSTASLKLPNYPVIYGAPDGRVFMAGPDQQSRYLDTAGTGRWFSGPKRLQGKRAYGTSAMYDDGKILVTGGASTNSTAPTKTAEIIDLNASTPAWRWTGPMRYARKHGNATLLPDGTVLVTGGSSSTAFNDAAGAVLAAELWNPASGTWTTLASAKVPRIYHSSALLLPDGRVLSVGGGRPKAKNGGVHNENAEIFEPPYLFRGQRPNILSAPATAGYGAQILVETSTPADIAQVTFVKLSSVTHTFNMSQRFKRATFTRVANGVTVDVPATATQFTPGHYMLFVLNALGVPSVARIIQIA